MSNVSKTTLKTYFVTGATPSEAQFGDFIDSSINVVDDVTSSLVTDSALKVLSAAGAKTLKDNLDAVDVRVIALENAGITFATNYYNKSEIDSTIASVGQTIHDLPYATQIANLNTVTDSLTIDVGNKASSTHQHAISDVTSLQSSLDDKVSTALLNATKSDLITSINSKVSAGHTHVMADITDMGDMDLSLYAKLTDLSAKADASHQHLVADITDIASVYYNRTEVDAKIAGVGVQADHTHVESDITDLDKYTQAQTNLAILDHSGLTNNPHSVTKAQVALGNVENLSSVDLFSSSASASFKTGIMSDVNVIADGINISLGSHKSDTSNPHAVTKSQVQLGNVPNIDVKALLDAHLASDNPHNIDLSFFDVYTKAQSDERVTLGLDSIRYAFTPPSPTDGAGSIGDLTWGADGSGAYKAYLKVADAAWRAINLFTENASGDAEFEFDTNFKKNVTVEGDAKIGNVSIGGGQLSSIINDLVLLSQQGNVVVNDNLIVNNELTVIEKVSLGSTLYVTNKVSIGGGLEVSGESLLGGVKIAGNNISTSTGDLNFTAENGIVVINDQLKVTEHVSLGSTLYVKSKATFDGAIDVAGCAQINNVSICSSTITTTDNSTLVLPDDVNIKKNLTVDGDLTVNGTQTILNTTTLDVEDNIVKLNKNVTGSPTADAGLEVERGDANNSKIYWDETADLWKLNISGTVKTIAFDEELDTLRTNTNTDFANVRASISSLGSQNDQEFANVRASINSFKSTNSSEHSALTDLINLRATIATLNSTKTTLQEQITAIEADMYSSASGS